MDELLNSYTQKISLSHITRPIHPRRTPIIPIALGQHQNGSTAESYLMASAFDSFASPTSPQNHSIKNKSMNSSADSPIILQFNNHIDEIFKCFICLSKAENPHLCPYCSKMVCYDCIKRWLMDQKKSFCPHCRANVRVSQLVNCRFVAEISQEIDKLTIQRKHKKEADKKSIVDSCQVHSLALGYYCETCKEAICSDCAMFEEQHKNHSFKKITEVYQQHLQVVKADCELLGARLTLLREYLREIDSNIHSLKKSKNDKGKEMDKVVREMKDRLDSQLKEKINSSQSLRTSISDEVDLLDKMHSELQRQIGQSSQSMLIAKTDEIRRMIKEVNEQEPIPYSTLHLQADFSSELVPDYDEGIFEVKNFSCLGLSDIVYSDPLYVNGLTWRLKVYPCGTGMAQGTFISVFLEMVKGLRNPTRYEYKVEMINFIDPKRNILREFSSVFETGECWGYNRFYKNELVRSERFVCPVNDTVKFKFFVRPPSYYQRCLEQKRYIRNLKDSRHKLQELVEDLRIKLEEALSKESTKEEQEFNETQQHSIATSYSNSDEDEQNSEGDVIQNSEGNSEFEETSEENTREQFSEDNLTRGQAPQNRIFNRSTLRNTDVACSPIEKTSDIDQSLLDVPQTWFAKLEQEKKFDGQIFLTDAIGESSEHFVFGLDNNQNQTDYIVPIRSLFSDASEESNDQWTSAVDSTQTHFEVELQTIE